MNRRSFLQACLASATAPYVVTTAGVLMPVKSLWTPPAWPWPEENYAYRWAANENIRKLVEAGWEAAYGHTEDLFPAQLMRISIKE